MPVKVHELPAFDPSAVLEAFLAHNPASFLAAERSPFFRLMYSAYDSKKSPSLFRAATAQMWRDFFDTHHEVLDSKLSDPSPGTAMHKLDPTRAAVTHGTVVGALNEMFSSVFEMFGLEEYESAVRGGQVASPMSFLLPPLYALRPNVDELLAVDPVVRLQVIALLQDGFGVTDATLWYTQVRSKRSRHSAYDDDRRRFAALRAVGIPAQEAIDYILRFPNLSVWQLVSAHAEGIPLDYIAEVF